MLSYNADKMNKKQLAVNSLILLCILMSRASRAWNHEISIGYGRSREVGLNYYNYGLFLNAKLYKFRKIDKTLIFTIDGSFSHWHASTKNNKYLSIVALSGAFRAYFSPPEQHKILPYLLFSFGPAYLSARYFGQREQGRNFSFQTTLGGGMEMKFSKHDFDFNLRLIHYCNAGIFRPNQGINILYVFSIGYLF